VRPDLVLTYRHCAFTARPSYVGVDIAQGVAISARQQLGLEDGDRLAVDLDVLTSIRRVQVNDVTYDLHWHIGGPLTGDSGEPVLGVCEHDRAVADAALICINPDPVDGREEILLSTAAHEKGHGVFEAPKWVLASQRASMPSLLDLDTPIPTRVHRTVTPDESHLSVTPPRGTEKFFEEVRANAFMGAFLAPAHRVYARLLFHCASLSLPLEDVQHFGSQTAAGTSDDFWANQIPPGNLAFANIRRRIAIDQLVTRLAADFHVTKRFIEVRLHHYGFLAQSKAVA
jgi:hypothetical protein